VSKTTTLAEGQVTASPHNTILIELVEADKTPAVVIIRRPEKPCVIHPRRFADSVGLLSEPGFHRGNLASH
jgi:hypothetical protein